MDMFFGFTFYSIVCIIGLCLYFRYLKKWKKNINGKHVMISGGSSGIGLSIAKETYLQGANVTIIARDEVKLKAAKDQLLKLKESSPNVARGTVLTYSVDIGGSKSALHEVVQAAEDSLGPVFMLVNCAGFAKAAKFEDIMESELRGMMNVNFFGSFLLTQEVVKSMKRGENGGILVFVSSQAGLFGIFGFTAYAAAKGALVKFAEALHMELKPHNISVTVSYPPDTDTPGFVTENQGKPTATALISETSGLFQPDEVAQSMVNDALCGKFASHLGIEGFMLSTLCAGMSPVTDLLSLLSQIFLSGIFRLVSLFYLWRFDRIVSTEHQKKEQTKKLE